MNTRGPEPSGFVSGGHGQLTPNGQLVLELRPPVGMISESSISPMVTIDGHPVPAHWHTNVLTVPAGSRQVVVRLPYMRHSGYARFVAHVQPGQRSVLHYAAPASMYDIGSMGNTPRRSHTGWLLALILGGALVALVIVVGMVVWAVAASPG